MVGLSRLRLVRQRKALTQQQLAERAGVNRVTIARLEGGQDDPFPTTVRKLADALGVVPEELMEPLGREPRGISLQRDDAKRLYRREPSGQPALGPIAEGARSDPEVTVVDGENVRRSLREDPELDLLVREAADQLLKFIPDARLTLGLLTDPDYGESEQLFLGITTSLQEGDALAALQRFDQQWWVRQARRAHGRLCIDLRDA
jgi:transcriptional regulator with XRE-family HTH domain